jgi:hypothetical protein
VLSDEPAGPAPAIEPAGPSGPATAEPLPALGDGIRMGLAARISAADHVLTAARPPLVEIFAAVARRVGADPAGPPMLWVPTMRVVTAITESPITIRDRPTGFFPRNNTCFSPLG